jgi:Spy/CpxP family protein refolding chaperone
MKKSLILLALAGSLFGQPQRPPMAAQYWWENKLAVNSLNLSEAQTKQLSAIQTSYVARLMELRSAVTKAETNLDEVIRLSPSDDLKAEAAIDQYAYARESLTRELSRLSFKMRNVLTADQWQDLLDRQSGRGGGRGGPGRGRRGSSGNGGPGGSGVSKATGSALSQK